MDKNIFLFFMLSFCILTLMGNESEQSSDHLTSEPLVLEIDITENPDKLPIPESDLKKTIIIDRFFNNYIIKPDNIINMGVCEFWGISRACVKSYYFKENEYLDVFLSNMKTDKEYAQQFRNTLPGMKYALPAMQPYENARVSNIVPCVFCPNVNKSGTYPHAIVFDTQNVAICDAIRAYNKAKNIA